MEEIKKELLKRENQIKPEKNERDPQWKFNFLLEQFKKESDRAAVILVASMIDELLGILLKSYLVAIPSADDALFDNATSPLATFSAKVDISYRIGLISGKFARDIHIVRKIRNSFAHDIYGCSFENGSVKSRIKELEKSMPYSVNITSEKRSDNLLEGDRGMFIYITGNMIWRLTSMINETMELKEAPMEWFYTFEPKRADK